MSFALLLLLGLAPGDTVRYSVAFPFPQPAHHEARIVVEFPAPRGDTLEVRMSRSSPGRYPLHEFAKNVYDVQATDTGGRPLPVLRRDPYQLAGVSPAAGRARRAERRRCEVPRRVGTGLTFGSAGRSATTILREESPHGNSPTRTPGAPRVRTGFGAMIIGIADVYTSSVRDDNEAVALIHRAGERGRRERPAHRGGSGTHQPVTMHAGAAAIASGPA